MSRGNVVECRARIVLGCAGQIKPGNHTNKIECTWGWHADVDKQNMCYIDTCVNQQCQQEARSSSAGYQYVSIITIHTLTLQTSDHCKSSQPINTINHGCCKQKKSLASIKQPKTTIGHCKRILLNGTSVFMNHPQFHPLRRCWLNINYVRFINGWMSNLVGHWFSTVTIVLSV